MELFRTLALTGYYPVLTWSTYLLAGMAVGRLDLRRLRVAVGLLVVGTTVAVAAAAGSALLLGPGGGAAVLGADALEQRNYGTTPTDSWWWLAINAPHSGTPINFAHTTGTALAVLGAMLLLARWSRALVWLPAALGSAPLTLYTLHVVLLSGYSGENEPDRVLVGLWVAHVIGAVLIGVLLRLLGWRGPLEAVVSVVGRTVRRLVDRRPPGPPAAAGAAPPDGTATPHGTATTDDPAPEPPGALFRGASGPDGLSRKPLVPDPPTNPLPQIPPQAVGRAPEPVDRAARSSRAR